MEIVNLLQFIGQLTALIALLKTRTDIKGTARKKRDDALDALQKAANATVGYYRALEAGERTNRIKESELATLWVTCANRIRDYDEGLAVRFELKQRYWLSPETWSEQQVEDARIGLEDITADAERLLKFKVKPVKKTKRTKL